LTVVRFLIKSLWILRDCPFPFEADAIFSSFTYETYVSRSIILLEARRKKMDSIIDYDTVKTLVANPPSLDPCPNFFNLHALQTHFAQALKHLPCLQSTVNRWSGEVMSKKMYALVDGTPFKADYKPKTDVPNFPKIFEADGITPIPYTQAKLL
jgi:hypothetical protein